MKSKSYEALSDEEKNRFARHLVLPEVGELGQQRLKTARVLIVGVGGLGAPAALYLAAAGVGTLGLVDADIVDLSNLQRQILYDTKDVGDKKTEAANARLRALNPNINVKQHVEKFTAANALDLIEGYDIILDGTDNFSAHYIVSDACVLAGKALVYGNVYRFEGQVGVVVPQKGPCYRCLYPEPPPLGVVPSCVDAGVLGVVPGVIGTLQALEVMKVILGIGRAAYDHVLRFDALAMNFREIKVQRDPHCAVCGDHPSITKLVTVSDEFICGALSEITADQLRDALRSEHPPYLLDVRNPDEYAMQHLEGANLIPLPALAQRLDELVITQDIVVYCHSGVRSAQALQFLQAHGYARTRHLKGGIVSMQQVVPQTRQAS